MCPNLKANFFMNTKLALPSVCSENKNVSEHEL